MPKTDRRENHVYYECPECGRTVLILYDDPEPKVELTCRDGHSPADMAKLNAADT